MTPKLLLHIHVSFCTGNKMALSNVNQILLRNIDLLESERPLLINLDADELIPEWTSHYPNAQFTCFNNNFAQYQSIKRKQFSQVSSLFDCYYRGATQHDLVVIAFPKSKAELGFTLAMIAPFVNADTMILFVGDNKSGIKSVDKQSTDFIEYCIKQDSARHCLLFSGKYTKSQQSFSVNEWFTHYEVSIAGHSIKIAALPGVFSQKGLDKGTQVLLDNLPDIVEGKVLDFGCGAGVISATLGKIFPDLPMTLVDVSALAIRSSEETLRLNGLTGTCIASDGLSEVKESFDWIVSNPPFHQGLKTHYAATELFLSNCVKHMTKKASLLVVANSFLKYQSIMEQSVGFTVHVAKENGFTVYLSQKNLK